MRVRSWGPWALEGVRLIHDRTGYVVCAHLQALRRGMVLGHARRQPWATQADVSALREALGELSREAEARVARDDRDAEQRRAAGITGAAPRWATAGRRVA